MEFYERIYRDRIERNRQELQKLGEDELKRLIGEIEVRTRKGASLDSQTLDARLAGIRSLMNAQECLIRYRRWIFYILVVSSLVCIAASYAPTFEIGWPGSKTVTLTTIAYFLLGVTFFGGFLFLREMFWLDERILAISRETSRTETPKVSATISGRVVSQPRPIETPKQPKGEDLLGLAMSLRKLAGGFQFNDVTNSSSIPKMALDALESKEVNEKLGKGVSGWNAFFDEYSNLGIERAGRFKTLLDEFIASPRNEDGFKSVVLEFCGALSAHLTLLEKFYGMVKDVGVENVPPEIKKRYRLFKTEYNFFIQSLRGIADELDRFGAGLKGTAFLYFVDEFEDRYGIKLADA